MPAASAMRMQKRICLAGERHPAARPPILFNSPEVAHRLAPFCFVPSGWMDQASPECFRRSFVSGLRLFIGCSLVPDSPSAVVDGKGNDASTNVARPVLPRFST